MKKSPKMIKYDFLACVSLGTITSKDSLLRAIFATAYQQFLESGWIYFSIPCIKLKQNKLVFVSEMTTRYVDDEKKVYVEHDINIDDDKNDKINKNNE